MKKIILILFTAFCTNSFAGMYQKTQGNSQALPANNAVTPTAQSIVINVNPNSIYTSGSAALSITGAQGTPTYSVTSGLCTISGSTITAGSSAGTCVIQVIIPASTYFLASSATTSITVNALQNQTLTTVANPSSFNPSGNATLSTTGAQGSVSYAVQSGSCTISGSTVRASAAGTCVIRANAAATTGYLAGTATVSITVTQPATQEITSFYIDPNFLSLSTTTYLRVSGNNLGAVSYSVISGDCVIYMGNRMYTDSLGTCVIRATTAPNGSYSSTTRDLTINITY
jgi:hypothetical protein